MPKFKSIKLRIIEGRKLKPFDTAKVLQEHEDKITAIAGTDTSQLGDITALQTAVGNSSSGLVKDVADAQTDITALETAIGYDSIDVENDGDLESRISSLESQPAGSSYDDTEILDRLTVIEDAVGIREITIVIKRWGRSYVQINNTTKRMEGDAFNDVQQQVTFRVADGEYDVKLGSNFSAPDYYITKHITVDSTHTSFVIDGDDYI